MANIKILLLGTLIIITSISSLLIGSTLISFNDLISYFINKDLDNFSHIIIETSRLPRTIIASIVGASLALAGVLIQSLTKNPMASPSILGINASAMFFIVILSSMYNFPSIEYYLWSALLGSSLVGIIIYFLGSNSRNSLGLVLAGSALSAFFYSFSQAFLIINEQGLEDILFWLAGSVSNKELSIIYPIVPYVSIGFIISFLLVKQMNILALGDDSSKSLGVNINLVKFLMAFLVILLSSISVAIAGSIAFIGLLVPHIVKSIFPQDNKYIIPASIFLGANLLLIADILSRILIAPREVPIGVITILIGAPFFIYLLVKRIRYE